MCTPLPRGRRGQAVLVGIASLAAAMLAPGGHLAGADPIADKRAEAARIADRLEQLNTQVEILAEDYNAATIALDELEGRIAAQQAKVAATQAQLADKRNEVRAYAVEAYVRGGDSVVMPLLLQGEASDFGQRSGYLSAAVDDRRDVIDELRATEEDVQAEIGVLDVAQAEAEATMAQIEQRRSQAEAAVAEQARLRDQAQGELAALVQAEQQRQAAEQAAAAARRAEQAAAAARAAPRPAARRSDAAAAAAPDEPAPAVRGAAAQAVAAARAQIGEPYQWGAAGPDSFDCSGLTMYAWGQAGVSLPHNSAMQYSATRRIGASQLEPGDLVFYGFDRIHHVAMYVGGGRIVHAPHAGDNVREDSIHYWDDLRGYGRV